MYFFIRMHDVTSGIGIGMVSLEAKVLGIGYRVLSLIS